MEQRYGPLLRTRLGITEEGSSGSPLFSKTGMIVGHLHGGQSACHFPDGWDMFGALAYDWATGPADDNQLRHFLNPSKRAITRMAGMSLKEAHRARRHSPRGRGTDPSQRPRKNPRRARHHKDYDAAIEK